MVKNFPLPQRLFSSPVAWPIGGAGGYGLAVVLGERRAVETVAYVYAIDSSARLLPGFPWLREQPSALAPGNSVLAASARGELLALDLTGSLRVWRDGRDAASGGMLSPSLSLLATAPVDVVGSNGSVRAQVLLARDMRPHGESLNAIGVLVQGRPGAGFPMALAGIPETQPPVVDAAGNRVFVVLRTGQVDGVSLADGIRLPGFPTAALSAPRPLGGFRLAMSADGASLFLANGGTDLIRIGIAGTVRPTITPLRLAGRRIGAVVPHGAGLMLGWDAASGDLVVFDPQGQQHGVLPLGQVYGDKAPLLALSAAHGGEDLALVGAEATDPLQRVDQLFADRAPAAARTEVEGLAREEALLRYKTRELTAAQQLELRKELSQLKRGWLEREAGVGPVATLLRVAPATRVTVVRGFGRAAPRVLLEDRIEGHDSDTGFSQCEHVMPVFWRDSGRGAPLLFVGLNARDAKATPPASLRAYTLPLI